MKLDPSLITALAGAVVSVFAAWSAHKKSRVQLIEERRLKSDNDAITVLSEQVFDLKKRLDSLQTINQNLREENVMQRYKISDLEEENKSLLEQNFDYEIQIVDLEKRVNNLEKELEKN